MHIIALISLNFFSFLIIDLTVRRILMGKITIVDHPILKHSLTILRDKTTLTALYRRHSALAAQILIIEATRDIGLQTKTIETPLAQMKGYEIQQSIVFVPVLRAGISMLYPALDLLPFASVGFIGLERSEETAVAREYYQKFPESLHDKHILVIDPMIATGGSLIDTVSALNKKEPASVRAICMVAAPEGIQWLKDKAPFVDLYVAAIDEGLNESKFIVPGLGDFGDRYFNT